MRLTLAAFIVISAVLAAAVPHHTGQRIGMAIPLTKCSELVNADESVDLHALTSHVASVDAKIVRGLENYEHNTGTKQPFDVKTVEERANGVPLTPMKKNRGWYGTILVGSPAERFTVLFDTGSSDLFLPTITCPTCEGHTLWNTSSSSTSKIFNQSFRIRYGDGSVVAGDLYNDTVSVSGFTVIDQTLGGAMTYPPRLERSKFVPDGVMGLAFQSISASYTRPIIETLFFQQQVAKSVISFKLSSPGAELYIGGSNSTLYTGSFTYVPVTKKGYWQVDVDYIQGNGETIMSNFAAIIDTGASCINGPYSEVFALHTTLGGRPANELGKFGGKSFFSFPCTSFPTISISLGGTSFSISPLALNLGHMSRGSPDCVSAIVASQKSYSFWVLGTVFLQSIYTTFDYENLQVGFAQLATGVLEGVV